MPWFARNHITFGSSVKASKTWKTEHSFGNEFPSHLERPSGYYLHGIHPCLHESPFLVTKNIFPTPSLYISVYVSGRWKKDLSSRNVVGAMRVIEGVLCRFCVQRARGLQIRSDNVSEYCLCNGTPSLSVLVSVPVLFFKYSFFQLLFFFRICKWVPLFLPLLCFSKYQIIISLWFPAFFHVWQV